MGHCSRAMPLLERPWRGCRRLSYGGGARHTRLERAPFTARSLFFQIVTRATTTRTSTPCKAPPPDNHLPTARAADSKISSGVPNVASGPAERTHRRPPSNFHSISTPQGSQPASSPKWSRPALPSIRVQNDEMPFGRSEGCAARRSTNPPMSAVTCLHLGSAAYPVRYGPLTPMPLTSNFAFRVPSWPWFEGSAGTRAPWATLDTSPCEPSE
jgi:hypothetical protein